MAFTLRPYQQELVGQVDGALLDGATPCLVAPTGSGKTVMLAELCRLALARGERVVVAAHRHEIIGQLIKSLGSHLDTRIGVVTAKHTSPTRDVTVTMMPTLARRPKDIQRLAGFTFMLDEAHHLSSKSYQRILGELAPSRFLGATATPITPTGAGLGKYGISKLILGPQPQWLMDQGSLCKYKLYAATGEINTEGVTQRGGDYATNELAERVVEINGDVIRDYRQFNPTQAPTIAVTVTIDHAYELRDIYEAAGHSAQVVIGETPQAIRQDAFKRFEEGRLKVIVSVALIDEGLDLPAATCLQLLRPTKSLRLWKQLVGRVLRPSPGKEHAIIIDHGGTCMELPLPCEPIAWTLEGRIKHKGAPRELDEDREVTSRPEKPEENGFVLEEVTPAYIIGKRLSDRMAKFRRVRGGIRGGILPLSGLWKYANNPIGLDADSRRWIEQRLGLERNYCDKQPELPV